MLKVDAHDTQKQAPLYTIESDRLLEEFDHQLAWFSLYEKQFLENHEKEFKESGEHQDIVVCFEKNRREVQKSKKEFIDFRNSFIQRLDSIGPAAPYTTILIESACDRMTQEYIQLMQEFIFPKRWEEMYEDHLASPDESLR